MKYTLNQKIASVRFAMTQKNSDTAAKKLGISFYAVKAWSEKYRDIIEKNNDLSNEAICSLIIDDLNKKRKEVKNENLERYRSEIRAIGKDGLNFRQRVRQLLKQRKWKYADLAKEVDSPISSLSTYINGGYMSESMMGKVSRALGTTAKYLKTGVYHDTIAFPTMEEIQAQEESEVNEKIEAFAEEKLKTEQLKVVQIPPEHENINTYSEPDNYARVFANVEKSVNVLNDEYAALKDDYKEENKDLKADIRHLKEQIRSLQEQQTSMMSLILNMMNAQQNTYTNKNNFKQTNGHHAPATTKIGDVYDKDFNKKI